MEQPRFLTLEEVLRIHAVSLQKHGGSPGIREAGGLESAVMQPQQDYFYAQADLFAIAASYAFHIAEWQAFVDGNKRTALGAALVFLEAHGISTNVDNGGFTDSPHLNDLEAPGIITICKKDMLYNAMIAISSHALDKAGLAALFRRLFQK